MDSPKACGPPPSEAVYTDLDTAVAAIQGHAQCNGYALSRRDSTPRRVVYVCDRFGKPRVNKNTPVVHESKKRLGSASKKCGCSMKVVLKQDPISEYWTLSIVEGAHNHESSIDAAAHPTYRTAALDPAVITQIKTLGTSGLAPALILSAIRVQFPTARLLQKDVSNIIQKERLKQLGGRTPMQWLLEVCLL